MNDDSALQKQGTLVPQPDTRAGGFPTGTSGLVSPHPVLIRTMNE